MKIVGQAADGEAALAMYERLRPDVAIIDLRMPLKEGSEVILELRRRWADARVLVLTAYNGDEDLRRALSAGALGCALKSSTGEDIIPAIRCVAAGCRWIPGDVAIRLAMHNEYGKLTPRELDVLREIAKGRANKEVADALGISEYTAKEHLKNILAKLRVSDRTKAVAAAIQRGIIHLG